MIGLQQQGWGLARLIGPRGLMIGFPGAVPGDPPCPAAKEPDLLAIE